MTLFQLRSSAEKLEETAGPAEQDNEENDEHLLQAGWTPAPPAPKGKRQSH